MDTVSRSQENARLQVLQEFLLRTMSGMEQAMDGCVSGLVFNPDEVCVSELEDRRSKKVVIPSARGST
jgi:hypothetical protein